MYASNRWNNCNFSFMLPHSRVLILSTSLFSCFGERLFRVCELAPFSQNAAAPYAREARFMEISRLAAIVTCSRLTGDNPRYYHFEAKAHRDYQVSSYVPTSM